jgi:rhodanese-related sulfurtransferase
MTTHTIPAVSTIDVSQFRQLMNEDPDLRVLDVRTGGEFETVHIPGSFNVPLDTLGEHARDLASVEHPVVLVCQTGGRASKAHDALSAAGKEGLYILDGGMAAWQRSGGDVATGGKQRWAMDRQVRLVAGSLVLAGVLGSVATPKAKWLAGGVAGGLVYSAVSNTCAMASMLAKVPYNRTDKCDIAGVLSELRADSARP